MELMRSKKTSVGVIPEDWEVKTINEAFEICNKYRFPISEKVRKNMQGQYPYYGPTKAQDYINEFRFDGEYSLIGEDGDHFLKWKSNPMTLLVNGKFNVNNHAHVLKGKENYTTTKWFYYYFKNRDITNSLTRQGAGRFKLSKVILEKIALPIPPFNEQILITKLLDDVETLICQLEKLIKKKRSIKQGAIQKLLRPKSGWITRKIRDIGELNGAGVDKKIKIDEESVRLVNYLDVYHRDFIFSKDLHHYVTAPSNKAVQCSVKQGDIYFTPSSEMRFDIAISAVAMEDIPDAVYSYHLYRLRLFEEWDLKFRTYFFKNKDFIRQAETLCEGSGKRYVLSLSKFKEIEICYPKDFEEQKYISSVLSDMDRELNKLESKLKKYTQLKQGMMQNLLAGKIRLIKKEEPHAVLT